MTEFYDHERKPLKPGDKVLIWDNQYKCFFHKGVVLGPTRHPFEHPKPDVQFEDGSVEPVGPGRMKKVEEESVMDVKLTKQMRRPDVIYYVHTDAGNAICSVPKEGQEILQTFISVGCIWTAIAPVIDWYQSDEEHERDIREILADIVFDLQEDRAALGNVQKIAQDARKLCEEYRPVSALNFAYYILDALGVGAVRPPTNREKDE